MIPGCHVQPEFSPGSVLAVWHGWCVCMFLPHSARRLMLISSTCRVAAQVAQAQTKQARALPCLRCCVGLASWASVLPGTPEQAKQAGHQKQAENRQGPSVLELVLCTLGSVTFTPFTMRPHWLCLGMAQQAITSKCPRGCQSPMASLQAKLGLPGVPCCLARSFSKPAA